MHHLPLTKNLTMKKSLPFLLAAFLAGCGAPTTWIGVPITGTHPFAADGSVVDAQFMKWWVGRPVTQEDVEFLARAVSAEARGELTRYKKTGDAAVQKSVSGIAYVIARTAAVRKTSVEGLIKGQPTFLSSWYLKNQAGNAENYRQFFLPPSRSPTGTSSAASPARRWGATTPRASIPTTSTTSPSHTAPRAGPSARESPRSNWAG